MAQSQEEKVLKAGALMDLEVLVLVTQAGQLLQQEHFEYEEQVHPF